MYVTIFCPLSSKYPLWIQMENDVEEVYVYVREKLSVAAVIFL